MRTAYFWPIYGDGDEIAFTYASSRAQQHVLDQLQGFGGTLLTDGYVAYQRYAEKTQQVTHATCWVHARRTFVKAEQIEPEAVAEALALIGKIYAIEAQIDAQGLSGEKKLKIRSTQSLLVTCRWHDINPYTYLVDVMQRVGDHPAAKVADLTPVNWKQKFADNPMKSDLESVRQ